jgi:hypothetical protein
MTTDKFEFTIGITPGYFNGDIIPGATGKLVSSLYTSASEAEEKFGLFISFNIHNTLTVYKEEWGCPEGGEKTFTLTAVRNPTFITDSKKWKDVCLYIAESMKKLLEQSTVTAEFSKVDMIYLQ